MCLSRHNRYYLKYCVCATITAAEYRNKTVIDVQEYYDTLADISRVSEAGHAAQRVMDLCPCVVTS